MVFHCAIGARVKRVHGEIAALRIMRKIAAELHDSMAAIGVDVFAQRGDLEWLVIDEHGDGAVIDARRQRAQSGLFGAADHFIRRGGGGDVDIAHRNAEQRIAHRSANNARLFAVRVEQGEDALKAGRFENGGGQRGHLLISAGTSLPFSMCAGA